jgi:hypothetical protein
MVTQPGQDGHPAWAGWSPSLGRMVTQPGQDGHPAWAGWSPSLAPRHSASPSSGVVGEPAGQAKRQVANRSPPHTTSLASPTWASVVRGGVASNVGVPACPRPLPSVSAADFSALYERCMKSGLKARVSFHHAAGQQTATITCVLSASATSAATAGKRRRQRRRRARRGRASATTNASESQLRPQPSSPVAAALPCDGTPSINTATLPPPSPPPPSPPLAAPPPRQATQDKM